MMIDPPAERIVDVTLLCFFDKYKGNFNHPKSNTNGGDDR